MTRWTACAALLLSLATSPALAEPRCMAHTLQDVAADEAPEEVRSRSNGAFGPITRVMVNKATGRMLYCGANTYCYNSNAFELTTPCRFKIDKERSSSRQFRYTAR